MSVITFFIQFFLYWLMLCALSELASSQKIRNALSTIIPILFTASLAAQFNILEPWQRLWLGTISLLFTTKAVILLRRTHSEISSFSKVGLLIYMSIWPGMDPQPFCQTKPCNEDGTRFVRGYLRFWLGALCFVVASKVVPVAAITNWLCLAGLLMMVHFGYAEMLSCGLRTMGWDVQPLFNAPFLSTSLRDFWSKRWNLAFVEMDKILFLPFAQIHFKPRTAILSVFAISGILHELAISYATAQWWGLPLLYFLLQGVGLLIEKKIFPPKTPSPASRAFAFVWILAPLPMLFNAPFQNDFIAPLARFAKYLDFQNLFNLALWLAAIGHFCTLFAGLQVPFRLNWKEELSRPTDLNRKICLFCAANVGVLIISFGSMTFSFHYQFHEKPLVLLATIIALFWIARLLVDFFYFHHTDWPKGPEFVIGHALLTTLFICLAGVYTWVVLLHWPLLFQAVPLPNLLGSEDQSPLWTTTHILSPRVMNNLLWLAVPLNLCALSTELIITARSHWQKNLHKLSNFNRKIMINYAAYVYSIIVAFAALTFILHNEILTRQKTAIGVSLIMAIFWMLRVVFDCFYLRHSNFPTFYQSMVSRAISATLALCLSAIYFFAVL